MGFRVVWTSVLQVGLFLEFAVVIWIIVVHYRTPHGWAKFRFGVIVDRGRKYSPEDWIMTVTGDMYEGIKQVRPILLGFEGHCCGPLKCVPCDVIYVLHLCNSVVICLTVTYLT